VQHPRRCRPRPSPRRSPVSCRALRRRRRASCSKISRSRRIHRRSIRIRCSTPSRRQLNKFQTAKVRIDGYTDSTGTTAGNADLSTARANAVKRYLTAHGVDGARIEAQGRAAEQPVAPNDTAQGRAENRRVELVVTSR
jgi:hypothetical protein